MVRCSHDSLTLHTGVEIDGVGESCPPKVQHLTNSWGIERLHRLFPGLRHLYHQVLFKGPGAGTCGEKNRNLHVRKLLILRAISSSWNQVSKIILHRSIGEYFGLSSHLKIQLNDWMAQFNLVCTYSLLVRCVILLLVVLTVGGVDKREPTATTLLAAGLRLVLQ